MPLNEKKKQQKTKNKQNYYRARFFVLVGSITANTTLFDIHRKISLF